MYIEDVSHCDYCMHRDECYDKTMCVDLCTSFEKDEEAYGSIMRKISGKNPEERKNK